MPQQNADPESLGLAVPLGALGALIERGRSVSDDKTIRLPNFLVYIVFGFNRVPAFRRERQVAS